MDFNLIKLGGSLIAPKHKDSFFDEEYLRRFSGFLKRNFGNGVAMTHGTGNVGHGFVKQYGISPKTYPIGKKLLEDYFGEIDKFFGFERFEAELVMGFDEDRIGSIGNMIVGGDIAKNLDIISSDDVFGHLLNFTDNVAYMVTDVDGVFDKDNNVIPVIDSENLSKLDFRTKPGDVTGSMRSKIEKIFSYKSDTRKSKASEVWILNGYDLDNWERVLKIGDGRGTRCVLR